VSAAPFALHVGGARDVLAGMPGASAGCIVTGPPYWGKRDCGRRAPVRRCRGSMRWCAESRYVVSARRGVRARTRRSVL